MSKKTLSNSQLEQYSRHAVEGLALGKNLRPEIPICDKGISFDGSIWVFSNSIEKKEDLVGKVPIQLKATQVSRFSSRKRSFSMELADLRNYYNSEGILILVVEVKPTGQTKVFYKPLLTLDLANIIKKYGNQATRTIQLREIEETNLYTVCWRFLVSKKLQPRILVENRPFSMESFTKYSISSLTYNPRLHHQNIHEHEFDLYGVYNGTTFPLAKMQIESLATQLNVEFTCKDLTFENEVTWEGTDKTVRLEVEGVFTLTFYGEKNYSFEYLHFNSLEKQLNAIPFITSLLSGYTVKSKYGQFELDDSPILRQQYEEYSRYCEFLRRTKLTYDILGIPQQFIFRTHDGDDLIHDLEILNLLILDNVVKGIDNKVANQLVNFPIGDQFILLYYSPANERKFCSAFKPEIAERQNMYKDETTTFLCSTYMLLNVEKLPQTINFDEQLICESFDRISAHAFSCDTAYELTNQFCLKCIKTYDQSKDIRMLRIAEHIYNIGFNNNVHDIPIRINRYQIQKRLHSFLPEKEKSELYQIKVTAKDNLEILFCTNVLLDNSFEAKHSFERMEPEMQQFYQSLPIFSLYEQLEGRVTHSPLKFEVSD